MTKFRVLGMTCSHCVGFVTEELESVPGVESVTVDLPTGFVTVTSTRTLSSAELRTAVETAGYTADDLNGR
jgi:copper chaperone CopZ